VAIAIAYPLPSSAGGARAALRAPLRETIPPRVYSPLGPRRLARPMAIPLVARQADRADAGDGAPPGRSRLPFSRARR